LTLVFGLGRSGLAVLEFLARRRRQACFYDDNPRPKDLQRAGALGFSACQVEEGRFNTVVAAPGVPIDHPLLRNLARNGAEIIGEVELAWRSRRLPLVGITGTAGKTTTTAFTAQLLQRRGVRARAAGNIDPPLIAVIDDPRLEAAAVELSSFQLERITRFAPEVAVLLNLGTDHIDRHGSLERYHAAKLRLLENLTPAHTLVYNSADPRVAAAAERCAAEKVAFAAGGTPRLSNARAAARAAGALLQKMARPASYEDLYNEALSLAAVPGRFEEVGRVNGVSFIDDSIATRTQSVLAALKAAPEPIAWIMGGMDKGADLDELLPLVRQKVRVVLAVGRDGARMAERFAKVTEVVAINEESGEEALAEAIASAMSRLQRGSVLLAPLATSFDQFADYKERSRVFRKLVSSMEGAGG